MSFVLRRSVLACLATLGAVLAPAADAQEVTVKVGAVRSISTVAILWASEKGYFKEFGIKVSMDTLDTAANSIALLAQNQLQLVEGGISAGYFNALEKNLPVTMVVDRVSSPLGHNLMLRPDLKGQITQLRQLKGKTIATNGQGAVSTYEVGKLLESDGLTINDVDIKVIPFTQYAVAFNNKAIDAAITIPPFTAQLLDGGHAVNFKDPDDTVKPHPLTIAVSMVNTDFAKANRELMRNYYVAYLRGIRLLPGLSRRRDPAGDDRARHAHRYRDPLRAAAQISLAGAQSERPHQYRQHARHAGLVREEQDEQQRVPGRPHR